MTFTPRRLSPTKAYPLFVIPFRMTNKMDNKAWQRLAEEKETIISLVPGEAAGTLEFLYADACRHYAIDPTQISYAQTNPTTTDEAWKNRAFETNHYKPVPTTLTVTIKGLRPKRKDYRKNGIVQALLFDKENSSSFPGDAKKSRGVESVNLPKITPQNITITFPKLSPGIYAIVLLHDEDEDGKMGTSFRLPTEGYGASNNPRLFRAPRFDECSFLVTGATEARQIEIPMNYL